MKALVIDDSKFQRLSIQRALTNKGYDVSIASDGESGLLAAQQTQPNIVILDMMLPKLSGIEVLRTLRREPATKDIPVIVLTGLSDKNKAKLLTEGATEYLEKSAALSDGNCTGLISAILRLAAVKK